MRYLFSLIVVSLFSSALAQQGQQNIILRVDASPDNKCMSAHKGGMWVLQSLGIRSINSPVGTVLVTLQRSEVSMHPQYARTLFFPIAYGDTIELDCQGDEGVSYVISAEK